LEATDSPLAGLLERGAPPPTLDEIRLYQQRRWGMRNDRPGGDNETCVIELCSLAAKGLKVKKNVEFDPHSFREERIRFIKGKLRECEPRFVVMYGAADKEHWGEIAGENLIEGKPVRLGSTRAIFTCHPVTPGLGNFYWIERAQKLCPA
jgi:hypothetical protein